MCTYTCTHTHTHIHTHTHTHTHTHIHTYTHTHTHTQSTLYTEASQNVSLQNLEVQLEAQDPVPTPEILAVENLTAVNVQLGQQFADIDSKVDSIDLEDILDEADNFENIR